MKQQQRRQQARRQQRRESARMARSSTAKPSSLCVVALVLLLSCATPMAQEEGKMALRGGKFHYYTDEEVKELKNSGAVVETNVGSKAGSVGEVPYIVVKDEEEPTTESESKPATPEEETTESAATPEVSSMSAESSASEGPPSIGYRDHEDWDWENDPARGGGGDADPTSRTGAAQTTSLIRGNHHTMLRRR